MTLAVNIGSRHYGFVIRSLRGKDTGATWQRHPVKKLAPELSRSAYNKLVLLNAADVELTDYH